jgi:hypothetical protein
MASMPKHRRNLTRNDAILSAQKTCEKGVSNRSLLKVKYMKIDLHDNEKHREAIPAI